jgi:hypothetical protein
VRGHVFDLVSDFDLEAEVFSKNGIRIVFEFVKKEADSVEVTMKTSNASSVSYTNFQILVAVPTVKFCC